MLKIVTAYNPTFSIYSIRQLENKIVAWLGNQGYPLEMQVARAFRRNGFDVIQSDYYTDTKTGKPREIDVFGLRVYTTSDKAYVIAVAFAIECKSSSSKPWILFTASDETNTLGNDITFNLILSPKADAKLGGFLSRKTEWIHEYFGGGVPAYGLTQAFTTGVDIPYQAIGSALGASIARAHDEFYEDDLHIVMPTVVIEGKMFECYLNEKDDIDIQEINQGAVMRNSSADFIDQPWIKVVSVTELERFAAQARNFADLIGIEGSKYLEKSGNWG